MVDNYSLWEALMDEPGPVLAMCSLEELARLRRALDTLIFERVHTYRENGATWASIAQDLGVTTSEAHRRYSGRTAPPDRRTAHKR